MLATLSNLRDNRLGLGDTHARHTASCKTLAQKPFYQPWRHANPSGRHRNSLTFQGSRLQLLRCWHACHAVKVGHHWFDGADRYRWLVLRDREACHAVENTCCRCRGTLLAHYHWCTALGLFLCLLLCMRSPCRHKRLMIICSITSAKLIRAVLTLWLVYHAVEDT